MELACGGRFRNPRSSEPPSGQIAEKPIGIGAAFTLAADANDPSFGHNDDVESAGNFVGCDLVSHLSAPSAGCFDERDYTQTDSQYKGG